MYFFKFILPKVAFGIEPLTAIAIGAGSSLLGSLFAGPDATQRAVEEIHTTVGRRGEHSAGHQHEERQQIDVQIVLA